MSARVLGAAARNSAARQGIARLQSTQLRGTSQLHFTPKGQLDGRLAIVTGASRGVGAELARVYAREGASVVVNYFQSKEKAAEVADDINSKYGAQTALATYGDVTVKDDMAKVVAQAEAHFGKPVSVVVNNALASYKFNPGSASASIKTVTWEDFDQQMKGALAGSVNTVKAALPSFEAAKFGKVVNIGTNLVYNPVVTYYDYTASKAALVGLTRNLAAELGPLGVRVNLVAGGLLETTDASSLTTKEVFEFVAAGTPLRKTTTVQDFAEACVFFAADASNAVTGQCLSVDGGLTMP